MAELGSTWELLIMGVISLYNFPLRACVGCVVFLLCPSLSNDLECHLYCQASVCTLPASVQQRTENRQEQLCRRSEGFATTPALRVTVLSETISVSVEIVSS